MSFEVIIVHLDSFYINFIGFFCNESPPGEEVFNGNSMVLFIDAIEAFS